MIALENIFQTVPNFFIFEQLLTELYKKKNYKLIRLTWHNNHKGCTKKNRFFKKALQIKFNYCQIMPQGGDW